MPGEIDHTYETKSTYQTRLEVLTASSDPAGSNIVQITVKATAGDFDNDDDVDQADFAHLQSCLTGVDGEDMSILLGCLIDHVMADP